MGAIMASIDVWTDINFHGTEHTFTDSNSDLTTIHTGPGGNLNDEISSFVVNSGTWRLFENTNYGGLGTQVFKPGDRIANCTDAGFPNKWVSSIQKLTD
jgi:hypothetical protein